MIHLVILVCCLLAAGVSSEDDPNYVSSNDQLHPGVLRSKDCPSCNPEECKRPSGCVAGLVKDWCGCCDVCGKAEFELCDHPKVSSHCPVNGSSVGHSMKSLSFAGNILLNIDIDIVQCIQWLSSYTFWAQDAPNKKIGGIEFSS